MPSATSGSRVALSLADGRRNSREPLRRSPLRPAPRCAPAAFHAGRERGAAAAASMRALDIVRGPDRTRGRHDSRVSQTELGRSRARSRSRAGSGGRSWREIRSVMRPELVTGPLVELVHHAVVVLVVATDVSGLLGQDEFSLERVDHLDLDQLPALRIDRVQCPRKACARPSCPAEPGRCAAANRIGCRNSSGERSCSRRRGSGPSAYGWASPRTGP